jgi:hypothetical protein
VIVGCFALIALLGLDGFLVDSQVGGKAFGAALALVSGGYAYVMWRAANVVMFTKGALVGTPLRPRWVEWDNVKEILVETDRDLYGRGGHVPVIRLKSGPSVKLGFFFAPVGGQHDIALDLANALNTRRRCALQDRLTA